MALVTKKVGLFVGVTAALLAGVSTQVFSLGVDTLDGKHIQYNVTDDMLLEADKDPNNWLMYGRDYESTRYSPLRQINGQNISDLVPKWNLSFGVIDAQDLQVTAVNGRLYVTSSQNQVFALEGTTGKILWSYKRKLPSDLGPKLCCSGVNRGVIAYGDKVYMATLDTHMVALNNQTGEVVWEKKLGDYKTGEIFTSMPMVVKGKLLIGNSGGDLGANAGTIYAMDPETGNEAWKTNTVPVTGKEDIAKTWGNDFLEDGGRRSVAAGFLRQGNGLHPVGRRQPCAGLRSARASRRQPLYRIDDRNRSRYRRHQGPLPVHAERCLGL